MPRETMISTEEAMHPVILAMVRTTREWIARGSKPERAVWAAGRIHAPIPYAPGYQTYIKAFRRAVAEGILPHPFARDGRGGAAYAARHPARPNEQPRVLRRAERVVAWVVVWVALLAGAGAARAEAPEEDEGPPAPKVYRTVREAWPVSGTTETLTAGQYVALERSWGSVYSNPRHLCPYCLAEQGRRARVHEAHHVDNAEWYESRGLPRAPILWRVQVYRCVEGHQFQVISRDYAIWWAPWVDRRERTRR